MKRILSSMLVWMGFAGLVIAASGEMQTRIFKVKRANAQELARVVEGIKSSEGRVTSDKNTNTLIVIDYPATLEAIASVVGELDTGSEQVEIKVLVIDAQDDFYRNAGIEIGVIPEARFSAFLAAAQTSSQANLRSQMMVRTLSGSPARLAVSRDEIFGETATFFDDGTVIVSPQRQAVGDFLEVVPTAHGDGTITVLVRPSSSSLTADGLPQERAILTQVNVESGDTVALGGLGSSQEQSVRETSFGFSRARKTNNKRRVMMFLTATAMKS